MSFFHFSLRKTLEKINKK